MGKSFVETVYEALRYQSVLSVNNKHVFSATFCDDTEFVSGCVFWLTKKFCIKKAELSLSLPSEQKDFILLEILMLALL